MVEGAGLEFGPGAPRPFRNSLKGKEKPRLEAGATLNWRSAIDGNRGTILAQHLQLHGLCRYR